MLYSILLIGSVLAAGEADGPTPAVEAPAPAEFIVLPLRLHSLSAPGLPEVDCRLSDDDYRRILGKANRVWHKAGVHWGLEAIVREPAARAQAFQFALTLDSRPDLGVYRVLVPDESRKTDGLHVFFVRELPVNGVWMGSNFAIVKETASLRPVEGGIDEPIPRVMAHELGHALGLSHRQDRTNLLASGTTGTLFNAAEVETARETARKVPGARTLAELREAAREAEGNGDVSRARRLWSWLAEVPGAEAEGRRELDRLGPADDSAKK